MTLEGRNIEAWLEPPKQEDNDTQHDTQQQHDDNLHTALLAYQAEVSHIARIVGDKLKENS